MSVNPESVPWMGLVRLTFPDLEARARLAAPCILEQAGVDVEGWAGLAQAAIDSIFRDSLAIDIRDGSMVRWVSPRWGKLQGVFRAGLPSEEVPPGTRPWPSAKPHPGNPSRIVLLVYSLIKGDPDNASDQERAREVLDALWGLITATAAKDSGRGAWRLDFSKAAVARVDRGWLCPITRRILGFTTGGPSPYGPNDKRVLTPRDFPRLPRANAGGLALEEREEVALWCAEDPAVTALRKQGLWTDLHDRIAVYPPFLRAQEHSAQIERPVLEIYEDRFKDGEINLLNCSTTMEMGVDIPNVALVANANVPPSISNYRQRVGRAGRRGEPWASAFTFCRDLPLDHAAFQNPTGFLAAPIAAPAVHLDSAPVVARHVHAALLGAFLRMSSNGVSIRTSTGTFLGATSDVAAPVTADNPADTFVIRLRDPEFTQAQDAHLSRLVQGTALERSDSASLCAETAESLEDLIRRWRTEYEKLLERAAATAEQEVRLAFEIRARRMHGEFLLSELARRGFTPSYGFPVDVVSFDHLFGHRRRGREEAAEGKIAFGEYRGRASRTLDVAIREYAPGAEVVIDGLVHESEGILPAWSAMADASGLEDLQVYWECKSCREFGLSRDTPSACPRCGAPEPRWHNALRPTGFLGRRLPHTGYESLGHIPFEMPKLAVITAWQALPDPAAGRLRADGAGRLITQSSGRDGKGYALCLCCGRAEAEKDELRGPDVLRNHKPLAPLRADQLVKGACPGGLTQRTRVQRNLRLIHETHTDVFELQLPQRANRGEALALAAALRESLAERLGAEAREIGLATCRSTGAAGQACVSAFLFDRAAGGAGLVARLAEFEVFKSCLERAINWLDCNQECDHGCPACILRPDLNFGEEFPDRPGAHTLVQEMYGRLHIPLELKAFGAETKLVGQPLLHWLERHHLAGRLRSLSVYLHGSPKDWELEADAWPLAGFLDRVSDLGVPVTLSLASRALTDRSLELAQKLDLHRLAARAVLAHVPALPLVRGAPLLAIAGVDSAFVGVGAADLLDATPGPSWGLGQNKPLVYGAVDAPQAAQAIDADRLIALSAGNAWRIQLTDELDGAAADFGDKFWKALATAAPLAIAAVKDKGVSETVYTDRYLLTPLNFRLLLEVLTSMPGKTSGTRIQISTGRMERPEQIGYRFWDSFSEDRQREEVLRQLFQVTPTITPKSQQPHGRSLVVNLTDGRRLAILLDQGFGAWRTEGLVRHDFRQPPQKQAMEIKRADVRVRMAEQLGSPVILEFG
jgi:DEAD/DEAH box helicase domain-containing protein